MSQPADVPVTQSHGCGAVFGTLSSGTFSRLGLKSTVCPRGGAGPWQGFKMNKIWHEMWQIYRVVIKVRTYTNQEKVIKKRVKYLLIIINTIINV